ncbi:MAG: peptidase dimerization domain-containing protein, partial [Actinomycetota bacterium]
LTADAAFDLDLGAVPNGTASVYLGVKGILSWRLSARGGDWGGPVASAHHSSSGVVLANPAWSLVRALSSLVDDKEQPLISGLDVVIPPEDEPLVAALVDAWDFETELAGAAGAKAFKTDDPAAAVKAMLYAPALNINGLRSGYADGGKTIIPHIAEAVLDLRVPYGCDMDAIDREVRDRIASVAPEVEVVEDERCLPAKTRSDSSVARALIASHVDAGHAPEVWPSAPWWAPYYLFEQVLGLPFATGGAGYSAGAHAANEHASVAGIKEHMKQSAAFLFRFAESHAAAGGGGR